jgi:predicted PurR-regulated permease PerM
MAERPASSPPAAALRQRRIAGAAIAAWLLLLLQAHLFSALLSALLAYAVTMGLKRQLARHMPGHRAAVIAAGVTATFIVLLVGGLVLGLHDTWGPGGGLPHLLNMLADFLDRVRATLPPWLATRVPDSLAQLQQVGAQWLRANARDVQAWGQSGLRILAHVFVGLAIGLLSALDRLPERSAHWLRLAADGLESLAAAFTDIVAAQVRISFANAVLTGIFLLLALPVAGVHMPFATTLLALTFVLGLLPIIGNLLSNSAILIVALTVSPAVALAALLFLVGVHKLEYVLNAHFVSSRTSVPAPVLLGSMVMLEALFGVAGLVAAPIFCAWAFRQFSAIEQSG